MAKRLALALCVMLCAPAAADTKVVAVASQSPAEQLAAIILPREQILAIRVPRFDAAYAAEQAEDDEIIALEKSNPGIRKAVAAAASDEAHKGYGAALTLLQNDVAKIYANKFTAPELATLITFFSSETGRAMIMMSVEASGESVIDAHVERAAKARAFLKNPSESAKRDLTTLMQSGLLPKIRAINPEIAALSVSRFDDVANIVAAALPARVEASIKSFQAKPKP